jgi:adenylate cyclase class 2
MTVTYKGPSNANSLVKTREEIEVEIHSIEPWTALFKNLGLRTVFRYQKYRTIFGISERKLNGSQPNETVGGERNLKIMLDETPIGNYLELEGDQDLIIIAAKKLGYGKESYILLNYRSLYLEDCQRRGIVPSDMVFS